MAGSYHTPNRSYPYPLGIFLEYSAIVEGCSGKNMALSWKWPQHVPTFHVSLYFFHLLFSKMHLVVIVFSCFVLFLGCCGNYFFIQRVPDISHTPRIISSLVEILQNGIQHGYFLEVAPACPNLSCSPLFLILPSSFQQEAFGCDCFFMFCPVSGLVGWLWQLNFIRRVPDISHTPRIISSLVEIPQNGIQHGSFLKTMGWVTSQN